MTGILAIFLGGLVLYMIIDTLINGKLRIRIRGVKGRHNSDTR